MRLGTPADAVPVAALVTAAYRGDSSRRGWTHEADLVEGRRTTEAEVAALAAGPDSLLLIASCQEALVGCCALRAESAESATFGLFAVDPARQRGGVGGLLLSAAEEVAAASFGAERLRILVLRQRPELVAFYRRRGYGPTGETAPFAVDPFVDRPLRDDLEFVVFDKALGPRDRAAVDSDGGWVQSR